MLGSISLGGSPELLRSASVCTERTNILCEGDVSVRVRVSVEHGILRDVGIVDNSSSSADPGRDECLPLHQSVQQNQTGLREGVGGQGHAAAELSRERAELSNLRRDLDPLVLSSDTPACLPYPKPEPRHAEATFLHPLDCYRQLLVQVHRLLDILERIHDRFASLFLSGSVSLCL